MRQAIAHAIDRNLLLKTVSGGYGKPSVSPIPSSLKPFHTATDCSNIPSMKRPSNCSIKRAFRARPMDGASS